MTVLKKFFGSRKFWATLVGFVTLLGTAMEDGVLTPDEINALAAIVIGYVVSVAFEDGMTNRVNWNGLISTTETVQEIPETGTTVETIQPVITKEL